MKHLRVYDNSVNADADGTVPDPRLVLEISAGQLVWPAPDDLGGLRQTPDWAKPLLGAALP